MTAFATDRTRFSPSLLTSSSMPVSTPLGGSDPRDTRKCACKTDSVGKSALACNVGKRQRRIRQQLLRALDSPLAEPDMRRLTDAILKGAREVRHGKATLTRELGKRDVVIDPGLQQLYRAIALKGS